MPVTPYEVRENFEEAEDARLPSIIEDVDGQIEKKYRPGETFYVKLPESAPVTAKVMKTVGDIYRSRGWNVTLEEYCPDIFVFSDRHPNFWEKDAIKVVAFVGVVVFSTMGLWLPSLLHLVSR